MDLNQYLAALTGGGNPMEGMNANSMAAGQGGGVGGGPSAMGSVSGMQGENNMAMTGQANPEEDQMSAMLRALYGQGGGSGQPNMMQEYGQGRDMSQMGQAPRPMQRQRGPRVQNPQSGGPMNSYLQALMGGM
tara:strand:- start:379 stop:777 length:399 start_codon:yes stop_codon:yes gene_type:complete